MKLVAYIVGILLLSACAHKPSHGNELQRVQYRCGQSAGTLVMHYFPYQSHADLVYQGVTHRLLQQSAASGMWYSNGKYSVRGKGSELWLEVGRSAPIYCQQTQ